MAEGRNRADISYKLKQLELRLEAAERGSTFLKPTEPCVFISHKKEDTEFCEPIAQYLMRAGIDVYFDKYDRTLAALVAEGDPDKVTKRIQDGIDKSTHMLCIVSPTTILSYWVPFEVGYGYNSTKLSILTLKGVENESLPDYMRTTRIVGGTLSLNIYISEILGQPRTSLEEREIIYEHTKMRHPLDTVLDWSN